MSTLRVTLILAIMLAWSVPIVLAAQAKIPVPAGWTLVPQNAPHAALPSGLAIVVYTYKDGEPSNGIAQSRLLLISNGTLTAEATFVGYATWVEASPSGSHVLVTHSTNVNGVQTRSSSLVDMSGTVVWTKLRERRESIRFSQVGTSVFRWTPPHFMGTRGGTDISVYDLAGAPIRNISLGAAPRGVLVLDDAESVVIAHQHSLMRVNFSSTIPTTAWNVVLEELDTPITGLSSLGNSGLILIEGMYGAFIVINDDGVIQHRYTPKLLAEADPDRGFTDYTKFVPFALSSTKIGLFSGEPIGFELNLATGQLTEKTYPAAAPFGSLVTKRTGSSQVFILSPTQIVLRDFQ